ncbi:hypothetical protein LXL04_021107 [Taraxacum kok-saghyz]
MMEIVLLSAYKHENLVSLVGFCDEKGEKVLVYKHESNVSLDQHLHVARGLKYLHDDLGIQHRILHRVMKSSNILLDKNFTAKISDFGLSKVALANVPCSVIISSCVGTTGCWDPEYYNVVNLHKNLMFTLLGLYRSLTSPYIFHFIEVITQHTFSPNKSTHLMASSSSSSPSTPSFSSQTWKYHVFLSFRGEDTRKNFVDHLYTALEQQGIYTYKDDETLPRGQSINPSLMKAIEESKIAVIIFSKNYADSSWCLDELEYIMKCKHKMGQIVIPVFYDIDPAEVRKQKRKYGEAFLRHECENDKKVESWRNALVDASNISGWDTKFIANGYESKCIKEIVDAISHGLHTVTSSVDDNLVGVEARVQHLISKLKIGCSGKKMIGIWGVGGGGKTTLASCVYDEISRKFDGCCFVKNIREASSNKDGLERLQEKILCGVLKQKEMAVGRVEEGRRMIKDRLHHRKVLIVLDDVDNLEHLEELAGSRDWFGEGSRIIITTRDEHVLTGHKVDLIHNISLLNNDEAMKLFCKHSPRGYRRTKDYEQLSKDVVSYAGGLPLALRVLGRYLCDKEMNEWRSALARLKDIPDANILEKLKISFYGLTAKERELFLDIACFFKGSFKDDEGVMMILEACGFHPVIGIKVLIQKGLITISEDGEFGMHDLVQEMAHYIVRGEHTKNPEKHSRVWKEEDVRDICAMDAMMNLDETEAIRFQSVGSEELIRLLTVAANMKKLRWIELDIYDFPTVNTRQLIIIPENFQPRELCCLTLSGLLGNLLWEGHKYLPNLRMIKLSCLRMLIKTPDFTGLPNLEIFMVDGSPLLEEIHPSFGCLEKLLYVEIRDFDNLEILPRNTRSKKLEILVLSGYLSKIQQNIENFLPHNLNHIGEWLISGSLRKLDLSWRNLTDRDIRSAAVWELSNLQELHLRGNRFERLNFSHLRLPRLQYLDISSCKHLVELSELPSSITVVIAEKCRSLESFGDISNCKWLWNVSLWGDNKLGPLCGDTLLDSMFQGNAKDYFISISLTGIDNWRGPSVLWVDLINTYNMPLPHDWYNHFSGVLMFLKSNKECDIVKPEIIMKLGVVVDKELQSELFQESNATILETHYKHTHVGYVSFSSLRHTGCFSSTFDTISFSLEDEDLYGDAFRFRVVLVPKYDVMQTTKVAADSSEFWDEEVGYSKTFTILHDSNSFIKILWRPIYHW